MIERCWNQEPHHRPDISEVVHCLQTALVLRPGHADSNDNQVPDDTTSGSDLQRELPPGEFCFVALGGVLPSVTKKGRASENPAGHPFPTYLDDFPNSESSSSCLDLLPTEIQPETLGVKNPPRVGPKVILYPPSAYSCSGKGCEVSDIVRNAPNANSSLSTVSPFAGVCY